MFDENNLHDYGLLSITSCLFGLCWHYIICWFVSKYLSQGTTNVKDISVHFYYDFLLLIVFVLFCVFYMFDIVRNL